ncbi:SoxR reducing system RseC family protein [Sulfurivirga sp.]|uniref:SoxR reducing system RseC family protein n=1 Tax=Sulfurivirga sp. TaxID=2614236 RepID=UPI0025DFA7BB|nr:SoxR reducing system RseC family protein [Sulfurivirga sp.]
MSESMMHESTGTVVRVEGEWAWVETVRQSGCGSCAAKGACGTGVLENLFSARSAPIKLPNTLHARPGDRVVLALSEGALLRQSLWAYGVPLLGFFIGGLVGRALFSMEWSALLGAVVGMLAGWGVVRRFARIEPPMMTRILTQGDRQWLDIG